MDEKGKTPKTKPAERYGCCVLEPCPALFQPLLQRKKGGGQVDVLHLSTNTGSLQLPPALPTRWESQEPLQIAVDLPLARARTHLITASFNYRPSFPKGFQPISVLTSHPYQFAVALPCTVAATEAPQLLQAGAERTENSHKSEWSWTLLNWKFVCAVCSPPQMNTALVGNIKTSIHHKFVIDHMLETNTAADYLPLSACVPLSPYPWGQPV